MAWMDLDADGVRDSGEQPAANVPVRLLDCDDRQALATSTTASDGSYNFADVEPTTAPEGYCVEFSLANTPSGAGFSRYQSPDASAGNDSDVEPATSSGSPTRARTSLVVVDANEAERHIDAGIVDARGAQGVGGIAWRDKDRDGVRDPGEPLASDVITKLVNCKSGAAIDKSTTTSDGSYAFTALPTGKYCVKFDLRNLPKDSGFSPAHAADGTPMTDSDGNLGTVKHRPTTGRSYPVTVGRGQTVNTIGAGIVSRKSSNDDNNGDNNDNNDNNDNDPGNSGNDDGNSPIIDAGSFREAGGAMLPLGALIVGLAVGGLVLFQRMQRRTA